MTRIFMIGGVLAMALGTARAQEAAPLSTFLEKRVPDELAVEGVMLSRRNLSLHTEQVGEQFLISLIDLSTGQVVASTKLPSLPDDRDAAVAAVTHVVAELSHQVGPQPAPEPAQTRTDAVRDQVNEQRYKQDALRIGDVYALEGGPRSPMLVRRWVAYQGEQNHEVDPLSFYREVGREDLGERYAQRLTYRNVAFGVGIASLVGAGISFAASISKMTETSTAGCSVTQSQADFINCMNAMQAANDKIASDSHAYLVPALLFTLGAGVAFTIGTYYHYNANPITEDQAMSLADAYNHGLRRNLGLQTAERAPVIKSLKVAPFSTGATDGGLALGGTF